MVSSATPTTISSEVPPKKKLALVWLMRMVGSAATAARYSAPGKVRRARVRSRNSAGGRPGLPPGMKPPDFFRLLAWATGVEGTAREEEVNGREEMGDSRAL